MPTTLPAAIDFVQLARSGGRVSGVVPLEQLPRIVALCAGEPAGVARVDLEFGLDENGRATVTGRVEAAVEVVCQRCLEAFEMPLRADLALVVVTDDDAPLPAGHEPLEAGADKMDVHGLVEDEILLAMPPVARHARGDCEPPAGTEAGADAERIRPFAKLRGLIDEGKGG